jgi:hypothetical protein
MFEDPLYIILKSGVGRYTSKTFTPIEKETILVSAKHQLVKFRHKLICLFVGKRKKQNLTDL